MDMLDVDEYMELLEFRMQVWQEAQPPVTGPLKRFPPLLEWFVEPGDEDFVVLPKPKPKRKPRPRVYRSAASIRAERDEVQRRIDALNGADNGDMAITNLSPFAKSKAAARAGRRRFAKLDRDLEKFSNLSARLSRLNGRLASAEAREAKRASDSGHAPDEAN